MKLTVFISVVALALVSACTTPTTPDPTPNTPQYAQIATSAVSGYQVELYADAPATVGYTPMHVRILRGGKPLTDVHLTVNPEMDMGTMHHSCPVEQPDDVDADANGFFHFATVFTMPSETQWTVGITFHDHTLDSVETVHLRVPVAAASTVRTVKDGSNTKYVLTLVSPTTLVGMNDIKFNIYRSTDGYAYTPVDDATVTFAPSMPSMGHGSNGNIQPVHSKDGWYTGRVNYTMTGDWQVDLTLKTVGNDSFTASYPVIIR